MVIESSEVTIIVVPRDRYSVAKDNLEAILELTDEPCELIYLDAKSPKPLSEWIASKAAEHGFKHIRVDTYVSPNEARNITLEHVKTPYVLFVDNDVIVGENWFRPLLDCAAETGAAVVTPLICEGLPVHTEIHHAGGQFTDELDTFFSQGSTVRDVNEIIYRQGELVSEVRDDIKRMPTQVSEFHCFLAKTSVIEQVGKFDPEIFSTKDHIDFSIGVYSLGEQIYLEPKSIATFVIPNRLSPLNSDDWVYFLLRWSSAWQHRSLMRLREKWDLPADGFVKHRNSYMGWRYAEGIVSPVLRRIPILGDNNLFVRAGRKASMPFLGLISRFIVSNDDRRRANNRST